MFMCCLVSVPVLNHPHYTAFYFITGFEIKSDGPLTTAETVSEAVSESKMSDWQGILRGGFAAKVTGWNQTSDVAHMWHEL